MNCADAVERLSAALDGELPPADAAGLQGHLDTCDVCGRRFRTLRQVRAAVKATVFPPVGGSGFDAHVLERVRVEDPAPLRFSRAWLATAAALIVAVSSAVLIVRDDAPLPRRPQPLLATPGLGSAATLPGWNEGRVVPGADCGMPGAASCIVQRD
jgi:anti-sigma factor RsiW